MQFYFKVNIFHYFVLLAEWGDEELYFRGNNLYLFYIVWIIKYITNCGV